MSTAADELAFEPPLEDNPAKWDAAEKKALEFPRKFIDQAVALSEAMRGWSRDRTELDRIRGLVVRSLIILAANCKAALAELEPEAGALPLADEAGVAPAEPGAEPPSKSAIEAMALRGVERMIAQLLAELGVYRAELLGHTYEDVLFEGQKVQDPFEVLESQQRGKASEIRVREVVSDLWVMRQGDHIKVVQRGKVIC